MRKHTIVILLILINTVLFAQNNSALSYFNAGGQEYINNNTDKAIKVVEEGLSKYPKDEKLKKLYEKLKQKKKEEDEKKKQKEKEQQPPQQQNQNGNQQQSGNQQQKQDQQGQDKNQQQQKQVQQPGQMSNEEAQRLLDAMSAEEGKTQQKLTKDKGKPVNVRIQKDW